MLSLEVPRAWSSKLPELLGELLAIQPPSSGVLEVEVRAGKLLQNGQGFVPGVSKSLFEGMLKHLVVSNKYPCVETKTIDVAMLENLRISLDASTLALKEAVRKERTGGPFDFVTTNEVGKHTFDLRVSAAFEVPEKKTFKRELELAVKACTPVSALFVDSLGY